MSERSINFENKKIEKSDFYKNKKAFQIYDIYVNKILVSKRDPYDKKIHLYTLLDIIIMMSLDNYV